MRSINKLDLCAAENQVHCVNTFEDLVSTSFQGNVNAICWQRELIGDFSEIVLKLQSEENLTIVDQDVLAALELSKEGKLAKEILLRDFHNLQAQGASPTLNVIKCYERDEDFPFFPTDVYSYHVDRAPISTSTFLCTYHGASSDLLPNSQVTQKILLPEIRTKLKALYGGAEDEGFESFLREYFFDLHYQPKKGAKPINLGTGHLWRLAVDHPESPVPPCVHRAPVEKKGESRLLLIC